MSCSLTAGLPCPNDATRDIWITYLAHCAKTHHAGRPARATHEDHVPKFIFITRVEFGGRSYDRKKDGPFGTIDLFPRDQGNLSAALIQRIRISTLPFHAGDFVAQNAYISRLLVISLKTGDDKKEATRRYQQLTSRFVG